MTDKPLSFDSLQQLLAGFGQQHVLHHWHALSQSQQTILAAQVRELDLPELASLVRGEYGSTDFMALAARAESPPAVRADGSGADWSQAQAKLRGEDAMVRWPLLSSRVVKARVWDSISQKGCFLSARFPSELSFNFLLIVCWQSTKHMAVVFLYTS